MAARKPQGCRSHLRDASKRTPAAIVQSVAPEARIGDRSNFRVFSGRGLGVGNQCPLWVDSVEKVRFPSTEKIVLLKRKPLRCT